MIAIAIVAVLISLAVPIYSGFRIRAKVSECINTAAPVKFAISEYRQSYGEWPPSLEATGEGIHSGRGHYCNTIRSYESAIGAFTIDVNEPAVDFNLVNISPQLTPAVPRGEAGYGPRAGRR